MASDEALPENDEFREVRGMWQFPATYRLLCILSTPLNFSAPTPTMLERVVTYPAEKDHLTLLSNLHGRLLGLAAGASAAAKWMQSTAKFVRGNQYEFTALLPLLRSAKQSTQPSQGDRRGEDDVEIQVEKKEGNTMTDVSSRSRRQHTAHGEDGEDEEPMVFTFPSDFEEYAHQFSPALRLLVLYTVAETVLAYHDRLLTCGSMNDTPVEVLRWEPLGKDALNNRYWYFEDSERIYREPRYVPSKDPTHPTYQERTKTPRKGESQEDIEMAESPQVTKVEQPQEQPQGQQQQSKGKKKEGRGKSASDNKKHSSSESKPSSQSLTRSSLKEQTDRLVEDIFGPPDISQNSMVDTLGELPSVGPKDSLSTGLTTISAIFEEINNPENLDKQRAAIDDGVNPGEVANDSEDKPVIDKPLKRKRGRPKLTAAEKQARREASAAAALANSSSPFSGAAKSSRRKSGRIRKQPERHADPPSPSPTNGTPGSSAGPSGRPAKRPRVAETKFMDLTLRKCDQWETLTVGSEALEQLIERFCKEHDGSGIPSERGLIRRLREAVLPLVKEEEERVRKEEERVRKEMERKQKAELLVVSQKRSTRLEAIEIRRAEEAKRIEEEEEREKQLLQELYDHEQEVLANVAIAEREMLRDIFKARKLYGLADPESRDDEVILKRNLQRAILTRQKQKRGQQTDFEDDDYVADQDDDQSADSSSENDSAPEQAQTEQIHGPRRSSRSRSRSSDRRRYAHYAISKTHAGAELENENKRENEVDDNDDSNSVGRAGTIALAAVAAVAARMKDKDKEPTKANGSVKMEEKELSSKKESTVKQEQEDVDMQDVDQSAMSDEEQKEKLGTDEQHSKKEADESVVVKTELKPQASAGSPNTDTITSGFVEDNISDDFTWGKSKVDRAPLRVLDKFFFASSKTFEDVSLEKLNTDTDKPGNEEPSGKDEENNTKAGNNVGLEDAKMEPSTESKKEHIIGLGLLLPPESSPSDVQQVELSSVREWKIEYNKEDPKLWLRSHKAWYELRQPSAEYSAFSDVRSKFEICSRLYILGETMKASILTYDTVVEFLGMRYLHMDGYDEEDIVKIKRFIVQQMQMLARKNFLHCGFFKALLTKVRTENRKLAATASKNKKSIGISNNNSNVNSSRDRDSDSGSDSDSDSDNSKSHNAGKTPAKAVPKDEAGNKSGSSEENKVAESTFHKDIAMETEPDTSNHLEASENKLGQVKGSDHSSCAVRGDESEKIDAAGDSGDEALVSTKMNGNKHAFEESGDGTKKTKSPAIASREEDAKRDQDEVSDEGHHKLNGNANLEVPNGNAEHMDDRTGKHIQTPKTDTSSDLDPKEDEDSAVNGSATKSSMLKSEENPLDKKINNCFKDVDVSEKNADRKAGDMVKVNGNIGENNNLEMTN